MGLRLQEIERELLKSGPLPVIDSAPEQRKVNTPWNTQDGYDPCVNPLAHKCAVSKGGGGVMGPLPKGPCVCITSPCNC